MSTTVHIDLEIHFSWYHFGKWQNLSLLFGTSMGLAHKGAPATECSGGECQVNFLEATLLFHTKSVK
jgi:hypothetical protein